MRNRIMHWGAWLTTLLLTALVPAGTSILLILWDPPPVRALRDLVFDNMQRLAPRSYDPQAPVRVVVIDEESLAKVGQWPWPRQMLAHLVDRIGKAGAAAIVLDVILSEAQRDSSPGPSAGDAALAETLAQYPTVIGQALGAAGVPPLRKAGIVFAGDNPLNFVPHFPAAIVPLPAFAEAARGVGVLNWVPDRDLIVRTVPTLFAVGDKVVPSLAVEALRVAQGASSITVKSSNASGEEAFGTKTGVVALKVGAIEIATEKDGAVRVRYAGTRGERHIPAWQVLDDATDLSALEGVIVFVGASAAALSDIRATPIDPAVAGVDVHAELVEHVLAGVRLSRPDYGPGLESLATLAGCLLTALIAMTLRPLVGAGATVTLLVALIAASWFAFARMDLLMDAGLPALAMVGTFAAATVTVLRQSDLDKRRIREAFGRYLSPSVVEALAEDPSKLKLGGEIRPLTVLFSDIRGFTARSEELDAEAVLGFLNSVHAPMTEEVLRSGGTLDKFIGDGMMAFWNAPADTPDHVRAALRCALAMQHALAVIEADLMQGDAAAGRPHTPVAIGIGIHTGLACVGNVGSVRRFDYSAIGDTVNTAARIEQSCKVYGLPILVSEEVTTEAPDFAYLPIDEVALRGRAHASHLYALVGDADRADAAFNEFRALHQLALSAFQEGTADAELRISLCERHPLGAEFKSVYRLYRERLEARRTAVSAIV